MKRRSYPKAKRTAILRAAKEEGLTAVQVQQRFGVKPVDYYSWLKKYGWPKVRPTRSAAAPNVRRGRGSTPNVGRDRDGHSTSVAKRVLARVATANAFSWRNVQGWARPIIHGADWHLWRHGRTACGAWQWRPQWGAPQLLRDPPSGDACRRCAERSMSRLRRLWRDRRPQ